jgi:hypothetical protein
MKKAFVIALALILSLAVAVPVLAAEVPTDVTVLDSGGGGSPIIKCKWETPDDDLSMPGTQVDPPLVWEATKPVCYWAIVTDTEGKDNIAAVYVDVFHPMGPPEDGSFKYQLQLSVVDKVVGIPAFEAAWANGTISPDCIGINPATTLPFTYDEIMDELLQCSADIYMVEGGLYYEQPAGDYKVVIKAVDKQANQITLENHMLYVPIAAIEIDFTSLSFGSVSVCDNKQVDGDRTFVVPSEPAGPIPMNGATVRNIGNTLAQVTVHETDLFQGGIPLGKTGDEWNVEYDARLGDATHTNVFFDPCETVTLPDILELSTEEKLDFSIHIKKFGTTGTWTGTMTIGCVYVPFEP